MLPCETAESKSGEKNRHHHLAACPLGFLEIVGQCIMKQGLGYD